MTSVGLTSEVPTTGATTDGGVECVEIRTSLTFEAPTPFGISSAAMMEEKFGPRMTTLSFVSGFIDPVSEMWSGRELPLVVELRYKDGAIHWIDAEGESNQGIECVDRIEIELILDLVTDGGEFDEHRTVIAVLTEPQTLQLLADFVPTLMGSLDLDTIFSDPDWAIESVWLVGTWQGQDAGGRVMRAVVVNGTANTAVLARWGQESLQDLPVFQR